ncbi:lytic transglycosylase domain-containing protein [Methylobacterium sp. C25]|uniref:transglycosylase SLT domain-containing protein n=1 Tax=Methylobacterium sp. C25 TaxID=2721622 RepID=UPI001F15C276|nr:transglycosylase SLT domain-containing protein [Methylobacterium sp. C25]MCE4226363.1 lytic transglycosylase domain-containing protein [Methylobacterium sp. C25]
MLDALALTTLIGECAPGQAAAPLVAIVREASGFEPLVLSTIQSGHPLSVQAFSKDEAVALAMEMRVAGQHARLGLAGLDSRAVERLGLPVGDAFEPCTNLRVAARLLKDDPGALQPLGRRKGVPSPPPTATPAHGVPPTTLGSDQPVPEPTRDRPPVTRAWDVYGQAKASAALVYPTTE